MKRLFILIATFLFIFAFSTVYAEEKPPAFTKRNAVIFYSIPDQILMCQNKEEDITKGATQFEKTLQKYYKKRFNIISVHRTYIKTDADGKYPIEEKKHLFALSKGAQAIIVKINLLGNSTATDTYQNAFGAKQSITVPTTTIFYSEQLGDASMETFYCFETVRDYRPDTFALFGELWTKKMDDRTLTKNCVEAFIKDANKFIPPNKYTHTDEYNKYLAFYTGNAEEIGKFDRKAQN